MLWGGLVKSWGLCQYCTVGGSELSYHSDLTQLIVDFPWADVSTLCDVGSGIGSFSLPLAKSFSDIHITLIDLPDIIEQAKAVRTNYIFSPMLITRWAIL